MTKSLKIMFMILVINSIAHVARALPLAKGLPRRAALLPKLDFKYFIEPGYRQGFGVMFTWSFDEIIFSKSEIDNSHISRLTQIKTKEDVSLEILELKDLSGIENRKKLAMLNAYVMANGFEGQGE